MNYDGTVLEIKTSLVSYKKYRNWMSLFNLFVFVGCMGVLVGAPKMKSMQAKDHMVFQYFSENRFIVNNIELLRNIGTGTAIIAFVTMLLTLHFAQQSFHQGFFNVNTVRVNVNGAIFHLQNIQSLKFTFNSPKVFGDRSAKQGFQNWIEFFQNGEKHKYEFFLKNTVMEDELLSLLEEIKNSYGSVEIKIIETQKSWFRKLQEELGIDPQ